MPFAYIARIFLRFNSKARVFPLKYVVTKNADSIFRGIFLPPYPMCGPNFSIDQKKFSLLLERLMSTLHSDLPQTNEKSTTPKCSPYFETWNDHKQECVFSDPRAKDLQPIDTTKPRHRGVSPIRFRI